VTDRRWRQTAEAIAAIQTGDGAIPWESGRHVDPWNHVEAAMGLDAVGLHREARRAYHWLARTQRPDGAWAAAYVGGEVYDPILDANFCAYVATGAWHHFMSTGDDVFLRGVWATVERAIDFVLKLQLPNGAVAWARGADYVPWPRPLLTSSSCINLSLRCASAIASELALDRADWDRAADALVAAVRDERASGFEPKHRYSMDWYYPVVGGAVGGTTARDRLRERWDLFVIEGRGVLCVSDRPWVTTGETCELVLACLTAGRSDEAASLFEWVQHLRDDDGLYWTGANYPDGSRWPNERTTWSAASVLLAASALEGDRATNETFLPRAASLSPTC